MWTLTTEAPGVQRAVREGTGEELISERRDGRTIYRCQGRDGNQIFYCLELVVPEGTEEPSYTTTRRVYGTDEACTGEKNREIRGRTASFLAELSGDAEDAFWLFREAIGLVAA